jgi:hypothetical protein
MAEHYPDQKPVFWFDEVDRTTHASISVEAFQALRAERDSLKARVANGHDMYRLQQQVALMAEELDSLQAPAAKTGKLGIRAETKPGQPFSSFKDQEAMIDASVANYGDKQEISRRTLHEKIAMAKTPVG